MRIDMREVLFRGKRVDNGKWVYGFYFREHRGGYEWKAIILERSNFIDGIPYREVVPETVGQFTGLTDKNGTKIFEGDIVKYNLWDDKFDYCEVKFGYFYAAMDSYNGGPALGFYLADINGKADDIGFFENLYKFVEVIGNIHDNPELLEVMR